MPIAKGDCINQKMEYILPLMLSAPMPLILMLSAPMSLALMPSAPMPLTLMLCDSFHLGEFAARIKNKLRTKFSSLRYGSVG